MLERFDYSYVATNVVGAKKWMSRTDIVEKEVNRANIGEVTSVLLLLNCLKTNYSVH